MKSIFSFFLILLSLSAFSSNEGEIRDLLNECSIERSVTEFANSQLGWEQIEITDLKIKTSYGALDAIETGVISVIGALLPNQTDSIDFNNIEATFENMDGEVVVLKYKANTATFDDSFRNINKSHSYPVSYKKNGDLIAKFRLNGELLELDWVDVFFDIGEICTLEDI